MIQRRTFGANQYPKGSEERARLNLDARTSEYMPSYKYWAAYEVTAIEGKRLPMTDSRTFVSKSQAEEWLAARPAQWGDI